MLYRCSVCRLACAVELRENSSLEGVENLLQAPLQMFDTQHLQLAAFQALAPEQQQLLIKALFHAVNWLREVVGAWAGQVRGDAG